MKTLIVDAITNRTIETTEELVVTTLKQVKHNGKFYNIVNTYLDIHHNELVVEVAEAL